MRNHADAEPGAQEMAAWWTVGVGIGGGVEVGNPLGSHQNHGLIDKRARARLTLNSERYERVAGIVVVRIRRRPAKGQPPDEARTAFEELPRVGCDHCRQIDWRIDIVVVRYRFEIFISHALDIGIINFWEGNEQQSP